MTPASTRPGVALPGSVAVVTGGGSGQGRATALRLAAAGAITAVADADEGSARATSDAILERGGAAGAFAMDVADGDAVVDVFDRVRRDLGPVAILAAAAGVYPNPAVAWRRSLAEVERVFAVNALGAYHCSVEASRQMIDAGIDGRIVLWSSIAARLGQVGDVAYCASKAAVEGMARALSAELVRHGITVNVIAPGAIRTPMLRDVDLSFYDELLPTGGIGTSEEIAELVAYLVSPAARFVTGAVIPVDGGVSAGNGLLTLSARLQQVDPNVRSEALASIRSAPMADES